MPAAASASEALANDETKSDGGALRGAPQARGTAAQFGSPTRVRNRCEITGRPRAYYRKLGMSRIALRELGSKGLVPGLVKSSW